MKKLFSDGKIEISLHNKKGFCIVAAQNIKKDELIVINAVSPIGFNDVKKESFFNNYPMYWTKKQDAISFGAINLLNHSNNSNVRIKRDYRNKLMRAYALNDIKKGTELTIDYECKLWFKVI
jgi:hypothetical protein